VVTALTANGLAITGDRSIGDVIAQSGGHGPDLALRFFLLSGIGAVLLGIAGVVVLAIGSWDDQVATMRALRHQGVARRTVRGQAVGGALLQVVVAGVAGAGTAALAWWLSRRVVPLFADGAAAHYPATWPSPLDVAPTLIVAVIVLAGTATATALALWRTVERSTR
jgi:predicted lysophospholipase L1 biosynthesis ABC-type transport system permease subunit